MQSNLELCGKASFNNLCISLPSVEFHAIRSAQPVPDWRRTWRVPLVGFGLSKQREILGLFAVETLWRTLKFTFFLFFFHPLQCEAYLCAEEATCADLSAPRVGAWNPSRHTFPCFLAIRRPNPVSTALWKRRNNRSARWNVRKWKIDPSFQRDPAEAWKWRLRRLWRTR